MKLSQVIIQYRTAHNLSQRQFSAQCGVSTGYISLIEKEINPQTGKQMIPSLGVLNKLATGMAITVDELLSMCDDMPVSLQYEEKPAADNGDELTDTDRQLLTLLKQLTPQQKDLLIGLMKQMLQQD